MGNMFLLTLYPKEKYSRSNKRAVILIVINVDVIWGRDVGIPKDMKICSTTSKELTSEFITPILLRFIE